MAVVIDSRRSHALHSVLGGLILLLCIFIAQLDVAGTGAMFVGIFAVIFWPRYGSYVLGAFLIFILGLFQDLSSGGPAGGWAIIYLTVFILSRPRNREREKSFLWHWQYAAVWVLAAAIGVTFLTVMATAHMPDMSSLIYEILGTFAVYPVFYKFRSAFRSVFINTDDYGFA